MAGRFDIPDLVTALGKRTHPSVTTYNRLEGRPRTEDFTRALRAEVRDALWMLTRQWQLGEFDGQDAGSPVLARLQAEISPLVACRTSRAEPAPLDTAELPLEARVERRPPPDTLQHRLLTGRRWLRMIRSIGDYEAAFESRFAFADLQPGTTDAAICAHPSAWQFASALAGHAVDGLALPRRWPRTSNRCSTPSGPPGPIETRCGMRRRASSAGWVPRSPSPPARRTTDGNRRGWSTPSRSARRTAPCWRPRSTQVAGWTGRPWTSIRRPRRPAAEPGVPDRAADPGGLPGDAAPAVVDAGGRPDPTWARSARTPPT